MVEGLSIGLEVTLRVALDGQRLPALARALPKTSAVDLVEPQLAASSDQQVSQRTVRAVQHPVC